MKIANHYLPPISSGVGRGQLEAAVANAEFDRFDADLRCHEWRKVGYFGAAMMASQIGAEVLGRALGATPNPLGLAAGLGLAGAVAAVGLYQSHQWGRERDQLSAQIHAQGLIDQCVHGSPGDEHVPFLGKPATAGGGGRGLV